MSASPDEIRRARQIAAHSGWAKRDAREGTAAARQGFLRRFEHQVDPEGVLPEHERKRRAHHAMQAHMLRLAKKADVARKRNAAHRRADSLKKAESYIARMEEQGNDGLG